MKLKKKSKTSSKCFKTLKNIHLKAQNYTKECSYTVVQAQEKPF